MADKYLNQSSKVLLPLQKQIYFWAADQFLSTDRFSGMKVNMNSGTSDFKRNCGRAPESHGKSLTFHSTYEKVALTIGVVRKTGRRKQFYKLQDIFQKLHGKRMQLTTPTVKLKPDSATKSKDAGGDQLQHHWWCWWSLQHHIQQHFQSITFPLFLIKQDYKGASVLHSWWEASLTDNNDIQNDI